jgi:hypothetical protein
VRIGRQRAVTNCALQLHKRVKTGHPDGFWGGGIADAWRADDRTAILAVGQQARRKELKSQVNSISIERRSDKKTVT